MKSDISKHIKGYMLGGFIFLALLPCIIYFISLISSSSLRLNDAPVKYLNYVVITILVISGSVFAIWSNIDLLIIGKGGPADLFNKEISPRSKKLVTTGPYKFTRNPMVFGMNALYFAFAFFLNSFSALVFCIFLLSMVIIYLKYTEEKRLEKDFGIEYLEYKKKVSMIIPLPKKEIR
ncbi:isoprenylcysteine carboxylmethyltransferase family protein [uncultured Desulfobacter sp.]|uniref:methyltransferase family protein n=1 Tax=uncultured Desulfobacter sp. TaxID=240139 RepID=UPI002AA7E5D8|nr:isoprenylcysteine carboxylmethyltransferase family protein [uncultured Desulfobacter sp.]